MRCPATLTRLALAAAIFLPAVPARAQAGTVVITIQPAGGAAISPGLYGVNYVWNKIPGADFATFQSVLARVTHYTFARYPGGWNAERLDWAQNIETKQPPDQPGIDADSFLAAVPAATFIAASQGAIANPGMTGTFVARAVRLVRRYGGQVKTWEIGNEWWLQRGAGKDPSIYQQNLQNYAAYLAAIVPALKAADPGIQLYATGDWLQPDSFVTLRQDTGDETWGQIDGISVHTYCGADDPASRCADLPARIAAIRAVTGKTAIYDSEWAVPIRQNQDDYGIKNAALTMMAFQTLARAGIQMAAYWPPVTNVPGMALAAGDYSDGYATGYVFGWLQQFYQGTALTVTGALPAIAARSHGRVSLFIAGAGGPQNIALPLAGLGLSTVVSAQVMAAANPDDAQGDDARKVTITSLPVTIGTYDGQPAALFSLDPGTAGRGQSHEIARITLQ